MKGKKILLILILVIIVGAIVFVAVNASSGKKEEKVQNTTITQKTTNKKVTNTVTTSNVSKNKKTTIKELEDGTLYTLTNEDITADIVIGDNFFDTQLSDIYTNFSQYEGKTIEIEGFYLYSEPYTFIGRYSEANLCAYCPLGYSYFEYEWDGDYEFNFTEEEEWLKIKGTLKKGNDGVEYYYIDVLSIEVMNERGQETVKN